MSDARGVCLCAVRDVCVCVCVARLVLSVPVACVCVCVVSLRCVSVSCVCAECLRYVSVVSVCRALSLFALRVCVVSCVVMGLLLAKGSPFASRRLLFQSGALHCGGGVGFGVLFHMCVARPGIRMYCT